MAVFEIHAAYCSALASPKRLAILACLAVQEMSVTDLAEAIDAPLSTISRHLGALKSKHLVVARHEGNKVYYSTADSRIVEACAMIRTVLLEGMQKRGEIALEITTDDLFVDDDS